MAAQLREAVGQQCPKARNRVSVVAGGVNHDGLLRIGSVGLPYGIERLGQICTEPSSGFDVVDNGELGNRRTIGPIDDVELCIVFAHESCQLIVNLPSIRVREGRYGA